MAVEIRCEIGQIELAFRIGMFQCDGLVERIDIRLDALQELTKLVDQFGLLVQCAVVIEERIALEGSSGLPTPDRTPWPDAVRWCARCRYTRRRAPPPCRGSRCSLPRVRRCASRSPQRAQLGSRACADNTRTPAPRSRRPRWQRAAGVSPGQVAETPVHRR